MTRRELDQVNYGELLLCLVHIVHPIICITTANSFLTVYKCDSNLIVYFRMTWKAIINSDATRRDES
jgi:hypothetical protein